MLISQLVSNLKYDKHFYIIDTHTLIEIKCVNCESVNYPLIPIKIRI